jgi:hypothetical protein
MKKILVVYNCCGIRQNNLPMWSSHLNNILKQNYENFDVCISGCLISEDAKSYFQNLKNEYQNKIILSFIDEVLPVNITFNKSCIEASKYHNYDGFMYVASDVNFNDDVNVITKLVNLHFSDNIGITSAVVSADSGIDVWLGLDVLNNHLNNNHFEIPVGKTLNMHCMIFDKKIFESYNQKIIPDIFRTYCTESVYSFITASLGMKYVIHDKSVLLTHLIGRDGSSVGFGGNRGWQDMFNPNIPVEQRLMTQEAKDCGFGYEEYINIFIHDSEKYNDDNTHKNPEILYDFNKKSIFLTEEEFNYNNINIQFFSNE